MMCFGGLMAVFIGQLGVGARQGVKIYKCVQFSIHNSCIDLTLHRFAPWIGTRCIGVGLSKVS